MLLKAFVFLVFLVIARQTFNLLLLMGFHKTAYNHWPGPCRTVAPIENGSEGMALTKEGLAIITSGLDIAYRGDRTDPRMAAAEGKLFAFDFNNPDKNATELSLGVDFEFVPHGIGLWESPGEETRIFVVNHRKEAETVEIFKVAGSVADPTVVHVKTVRDPLFRSMNDVLATGSDSFYASNDGYLRYTLWRAVERFSNRYWGSVVHYDGAKARVVIGNQYEPNGLEISKDGRFVFISYPVLSMIDVYERSPETNDLSLQQKIPLGALPDNIFVHPKTGDLWIGAIDITHRYLEAMEDLDKWAPSMILRVRPLGPKDRPFEESKIYDVYRDDGHLMSTSSSAAVYGNRLLVGSVANKLVYCNMETESKLSRDDY